MLDKNFRLYPKAIEDLESIYLYGCEKFGVKKAADYIVEIEKGFQYVANYPDMSRNCDHIRKKLKSWPVGSHVIFFKPAKYGIVIIRVLHQSMDYPRHFT